MKRWVTRILHPLTPPFGPDGKTTVLVPIRVRTQQFTSPLELECDERWQIAFLTKRAREELLARPFHAWKVYYPAWRRQVATVIRFDEPRTRWFFPDLVVSTNPKVVTMGTFDRVMLLQEGQVVRVMRGADTRFLFGLLAQPLAEQVVDDELVANAQELGMDLDDLLSLRDI